MLNDVSRKNLSVLGGDIGGVKKGNAPPQVRAVGYDWVGGLDWRVLCAELLPQL